MPHDDRQIRMDEQLITQGFCPECEAPLKGLNVEVHANEHWDERHLDPRTHGDAIRRRNALLDYMSETDPEKE